MKIVHIVPAPFGPDGVVGGAEGYTFELARQMSDRVPTTLVTFGTRQREQLGRRSARTNDRRIRGSSAGSVPTPSASMCFERYRGTPMSFTAISSTCS